MEKGKDYTIGEEKINFKNDYVVNYKNKEFTVLSGRAVNWNVKATLGVTGNIELNLDPISLANGEWKASGENDEISDNEYQNFFVKNSNGLDVNTNIQRVGDVIYDGENKALKINEDEEKNPSGEGGYLRLKKGAIDFSNGFTFEFYGKFSRGLYVPENISSIDERLGFFSYTLNLGNVATPPGTGLRFFMQQGGNFMDTNIAGEESDNYQYIRTAGPSHVKIANFKKFSDFGFDVGEEFYFTLSYVTSDESDELVNKAWDRIDYYINGNRLGYCYMWKQRVYG